MNNTTSNLSNIFLKREGRRKRISSYDKGGGNDDRIYIKSGESKTFAEIDGCGIITHIWITLMSDSNPEEKDMLRKVVMRAYWDSEATPSIETPIGDFFGMGHAKSKNYVSAPMQMSPEDGKGFNSWWPMPYRKKARFEVANEGSTTLIFYFYVDYEEKKSLPDEALYFHAKWHRECPTGGKIEAEFKTHRDWCFSGNNLSGEGNYVILEADGKGQYCGCNINIHNLSRSGLWNWPGEGDDMIFIDGERTPSLSGTGTEDYVNMAWCPRQEYSSPYHGIILGGDDNWKGKITYYRYHIQDPVMFDKSIKVTIEHGHNNNRNDDWSTTAYWYQQEPHKSFGKMMSVNERLPIDDVQASFDEIQHFKLK